VYGKFSVARQRQGSSVPEMYIDLTPGTPAIYRREVLTKLCTIDYDILDNLLFGTDAVAYEYDTDWARSWIERDRAIFSELDVTPEKQEAIFSGNLLRFLSIE
jgi:hypothetical protein